MYRFYYIFTCSYIFWSSSTSARIFRGSLDGTQSIISIINTPYITLPVAMAFDYTNSKLYIADSGKDRLISFNIDGTGRSVIVTSDDPRGIAVDDVYVYWIQGTALYAVNKTGLRNTVIQCNNMNSVNTIVSVRRAQWLQRGIYCM